MSAESALSEAKVASLQKLLDAALAREQKALSDNLVFKAAIAAAEQRAAALEQLAASDLAKLSLASSPAGCTDATLGFPRITLMSPSHASSCFLTDRFVSLIAAPVTLAVDPMLGATFQGLLKAAKNDVRGLGSEAHFYELATTWLPSFVERVGSSHGDVSAVSLFSPTALGTPVWSFPSACKPELHVRAAVGGEGQPDHCPAYNGELKSAASEYALDQAVLYATLDLVRVFFPAPPSGTTSKGASGIAAAAAAATAAASRRLFYTHPPTGYALVGYPHVAYLLALEWVGKLLVSPVSQPFFLGSPQHRAAVEALPAHPYAPPEVLDLTTVRPWLTMRRGAEVEGVVEEEVCAWCVHQGTFRKLVRGDARSGPDFASMHAAYAALARLLPGAPAHLHLPSSVRLLYGVHAVLVEMPAVQGRAAVEGELVGGLLGAVASAIAWLARSGVVYTDLRPPNVMVDGRGQPWLVDFDDCLVVQQPVTSLQGYMEALAASPGAKKMDSFASSLAEGMQGAVEEALDRAFSEALAEAQGGGGSGGVGSSG